MKAQVSLPSQLFHTKMPFEIYIPQDHPLLVLDEAELAVDLAHEPGAFEVIHLDVDAGDPVNEAAQAFAWLALLAAAEPAAAPMPAPQPVLAPQLPPQIPQAPAASPSDVEMGCEQTQGDGHAVLDLNPPGLPPAGLHFLPLPPVHSWHAPT